MSGIYTTYTNSNLLALENGDLEKLCPAAFAKAPRSDVSERYGFVSSIEIVETMRGIGFVPTQVNSYMRRSEENRAFTKHMIRFRKTGASVKKLMVGDVVPQVIMTNSHDRSSQFSFFIGLFRVLCGNGLMVSDGPNVTPIVIRHTTSAVAGLLEVITALTKQQRNVFELVGDMRATKLTQARALKFANDALNLRPERAGAIDSAQLLNVRRPEDDGFDLWHVYNRTQENMMRGGLNGVTANNRAVVTRGVTSVNADMHINWGLWRLAVEAIEKARESARTGKSPAGKRAKPVEVASTTPSEAQASAEQSTEG